MVRGTVQLIFFICNVAESDLPVLLYFGESRTAWFYYRWGSNCRHASNEPRLRRIRCFLEFTTVVFRRVLTPCHNVNALLEWGRELTPCQTHSHDREDSAIAIGRSLKSNFSLKHLNLSNNSFAEKGSVLPSHPICLQSLIASSIINI